MSQLFICSASVLPMNIQDRFPSGLTVWISLQSKGLSRVFSNTTVQRYRFFGQGVWVWVSCSVPFDSLRPHELWPVRLLCPWASPGKNTGVDCHSLLQRIFLTQGLNPGLLHCRQILYRLSCREDLSQGEVAQSCPTLCYPMDCSLLGSSVHGIFQARVLERVARGWQLK